jgi:hypothetical protein
MKSYIPFTAARRQRLLAECLHKRAAGHAGLAFVEWEDGSKTIEAVDWDNDNSALVDQKGNRWFVRGLGGDPKDLVGVPVWDVYAGNAGVISTEASLLADAEQFQDRVYDVEAGEELPDDLVAEGLKDPNTGKTPGDVWRVHPVDEQTVETARAIERNEIEPVDPNELKRLEDMSELAVGEHESLLYQLTGGRFGSKVEIEEAEGVERVETDGGVRAGQQAANIGTAIDSAGQTPVPDPSDLDDGAAVYDLRPPDGYDGVAISARLPNQYDPNPVTRNDSKAAAEWHEHAGDRGTKEDLMLIFVGVGLATAVYLVFTGFPWLLGQIGGSGGGGGGGGEVITGLLPVLASRSGLRAIGQRIRSWLPV